MARRTRNRRFERIESEIVWRAIDVLDVGCQFEILREMATQFAVTARVNHSSGSNARAAVVALREAADILGHSPSMKEYRSLRRELPECELPADGNIRRWLGGGWHDCLRRALLDAVTDGDFSSTLVGQTYRYSDEEVLAALRECAADVGHVPTVSQYMQWAGRPEVLDRPGRRPRSLRHMMRLGGFRASLAQAGVISLSEARFAADGLPLPVRYSYTEEEMTTALRLVAERLKRSPRSTEYQHERDLICDEAFARGEMQVLPTSDVILRHLGPWNRALVTAGLKEVTPRRSARSRTSGATAATTSRHAYTIEEKLDALRAAWTAVGDPFSINAYRLWRRTQLENGADRIPSAITFEKTFGTWTAARERVLPSAATAKRRRCIHE